MAAMEETITTPARAEAVEEELDSASASASAGLVAAEGDGEFEPIEKLQSFGILAADIKKLKESGIATVGSVLQQPVRRLLAVKGLSDAKVEKIREAARKVHGGISFRTGTEVLHRRQQVIRITTGSRELDAILGGGVETGGITEVFGEFRTGKTQLSHTLCVTSQMQREQGGGCGKVIVVDTEGTFRPERVAEIAEKRYQLDPDTVLDNIRVARAFNVDDQVDLNFAIAAIIADDEEPTRLLIIDSVMNNFRTDYSGRGELAERQQRLNSYLGELKKIAEEFNIAVVLNNMVTADPGGSVFAGADAKKPIGGHVLAHAATTRISLRKGKGEQRIAKIYDSPSLPESEAVFAIGAHGIIDAE